MYLSEHGNSTYPELSKSYLREQEKKKKGLKQSTTTAHLTTTRLVNPESRPQYWQQHIFKAL